MKQRTMVRLGLAGLLLAFGRDVKATCAAPATFYIAPGGSDQNAGTTQAAPLKTFSKAWSKLVACDTLIVLDGTYLQNLSPPSGKSGSAGNPIVIRAEHDGGAVIDGEGSHNTLHLSSGNSYLVFEGFKVHNADDSVLNLDGAHHNTFRRMGLKSTRSSDNSWNGECGVCLGSGAHHNLIEDSWIWGRGRYKMLLYGDGSSGDVPYQNTFRRVVMRYDDETDREGEPQGAVSFYSAKENIAENMIILDGQMGPISKVVSSAAIYVTAHAQSSSGNKILGSLVLNNNSEGIHIDCDQSSTCQNNVLENTVFWDNARTGVALYHQNQANITGTVVKHVTAGAQGDEGIGNYNSKGYFTNNMLVNNGKWGYSGGVTTNFTFDYNNLFGNGSGNYKSQSPGAHDIQANPGLKHITRLEAGAPGDNAGDDGKDLGANLEKRYQDGALTGVDLWPWPGEARIRADMCSGITVGWCATTKSLTEYVWGYLGNPWPGSGTGDTTPPAAPTGVERTDTK